MKKIKDYEIKFATNTIVVSKKFSRNASKIGTDEFKTMMQLRELNMEIVEQVEAKRKPVHRATYKQMRAYLSCLEEAERWLKEFEVVRMASKEKANPYQHVCGWYEKNFPNHDDYPELDENGKIINYADVSEGSLAAKRTTIKVA